MLTSSGEAGVRLGLCLAAFGGGDLSRAVAAAGEFGQLALDLPTDTSLGLVDARRCLDDRRYRDEVAARLRDATVTCVSNSRDGQLLLGPHGPHTDPVLAGTEAEKRAHALRCSLGSIRLAERLGVPSVRLMLGCPDFARWLSWWGSDVSWADNVSAFHEHAGPLLAAAADTGITLLLEPHPKQVVYDRVSAEMVLAAANPPGVLGLCVDPANLAATGYDEVAAVTGWGSTMVAVHAKDLQRWRGAGIPPGAGWSRYGPQPPIRFRALGLGELDWPRVVSALLDEGYDGVLYVEHEDTLLPREQSIRRSLDYLRSLLPAGPAEGRTW
jgi:sugar phosphate isomerase/epimerase